MGGRVNDGAASARLLDLIKIAERIKVYFSDYVALGVQNPVKDIGPVNPAVIAGCKVDAKQPAFKPFTGFKTRSDLTLRPFRKGHLDEDGVRIDKIERRQIGRIGAALSALHQHDDLAAFQAERQGARHFIIAQTAHAQTYRYPTILIIGAGPIVIGQACEFDYSGAQACKALRRKATAVILVNSNPATIMTDPDLADATYIEPITPEVVAKIIEKERPALCPTMGGQTALNTALALDNGGAGEVRRGDDRRQARGHRQGRGPRAVPRGDGPDRAGEPEAPTPPTIAAREEYEDGLAAAPTWKAGLRREERARTRGAEAFKLGLPAIIRPAFTLGGTGGGVAYNREELRDICMQRHRCLAPRQILIDESVLGWKEYEMEVVRDKATTASSSAPSRTSTRWACIPATRSPSPPR
jgi:hypothetical protein